MRNLCGIRLGHDLMSSRGGACHVMGEHVILAWGIAIISWQGMSSDGMACRMCQLCHLIPCISNNDCVISIDDLNFSPQDILSKKDAPIV